MVTSAQQSADPVRGTLGTAMVVEDEALIAMSLEDGLSDAGFQIAGPFSTCADALGWLNTEAPVVAVLDAVLSDGTCLDLAKELRRRGIPFMIHSGLDEFDERAPELHDVRWIEKPAPVDVIVNVARDLMTR